MPAPEITLGFAHHRDYYGVAMTLQCVRGSLPPDMLERIEVICVDQTPEDEHGKEVVKLFRYGTGGFGRVSYHPFTDIVGTSHSRSKIFEVATAPVVVVVDCHITFPQHPDYPLWPTRVLEYFADQAHAKDILSGPILTDSIWQHNRKGKFSVMATHYADHLRSEMLGTWAGAWQCVCGKWEFATWKDGNMVRYEHVRMNPTFVKACPACGQRLPMLDWSGHDQLLERAGYLNLGVEGKVPFEISGNGLGMFAMRRDAWPGMPEGLWGFGAEELCLHALIRHHGGRAVCDPLVPWWHRFPRPGGTTYPNTHWYKARNYVIWFDKLKELTGDARWDRGVVYKHFVEQEKTMQPGEWEALAADPMGLVHGPSKQFVQPTMQEGKPVAYYKRTLEEVYNHYRGVPRDLDQHFPVIRELAANCDHITLFGKRKEADIAFAAGLMDRRTANPETTPTLISHNLERDTVLLELDNLLLGHPTVRGKEPVSVNYKRDELQSVAVPGIELTDALWLDTVHHADRMRGELLKFGGNVRRYIFARGTGAFGIEAEGGGPGMFDALREWVGAHPQWFVCYHTPGQYGLTVLSCHPEDKPPTPLVPWPPGRGPGTELKKILESIGIHQMPGCTCLQKMIEMDHLGVEGCRTHMDDIVTYMREMAPKWGWQGFLAAATWSMFTGLVWKINPTDPFPSLLKEAIRRAEAEEVLRDKGKRAI